MDQNTTMVPKLRQSMKGIEGRYVKTHLCGVLVHGLALYTHVWVDVHHKHDSNQVVTSIMKVLGDVRQRRGTFSHYYEFKQTIVVEKTKINIFLNCVPHL